MQVYEGAICSCEEDDRVYRFLVEDGGFIKYAGDSLPDMYASAPRHQLDRKALSPCFVDSHIHFSSFALFHSGVDLLSAESNEEILERIAGESAQSKAGILVGFGLSPHAVKEGHLPVRRDIDMVSGDKPVFLVKYDGHAATFNTALLEKLPSALHKERGFDAENGHLLNEAFLRSTDFVTRSIPSSALISGMLSAYDFMTRQGYGMLHTVSGVGFPKDLDVDLERWLGRGIGTGFQTRVYFQTMDIAKVVKRHLPRVGGCFATALDGSFGSMDAAVHEPYRGTDSRGILFYTDEQVNAFCREANRAGLQIQMHAVGDAAFDQAANALKAALDDSPREDHRHAIIHAMLPTDAGLDICARYGIHIPLQPALIHWRQEPLSYVESILGDRAERLTPLKTFFERGIRLSGGSDAPVSTPDPFTGIWNCCNHTSPGQSVSVGEALRMFTINGYWGSFDDTRRGSLRAGKIADMAILSSNPFTTAVDSLKEIRVEQTLLAGRPYTTKPKGSVSTILRGMLSRSMI